MPIDLIGSADGTRSCPDEQCRGHAPQRLSVRLVVSVWTQRLASGGPITATHTERRPIEIPELDKRCEYCGKPNDISPLVTAPHHTLVWPTPTFSSDTPIDLVVNDSGPKLTLEQRVTALEREVSRMKVGV